MLTRIVFSMYHKDMIAIIDYKAGNLTSVARALKYLGLSCQITNSADEIFRSDRVIFPGVGAAGKAMEVVRSVGLDAILKHVVAMGIPFMGICLGTQIIFETSEEGNTPCLGLIPGRVRRFSQSGLKIPHMGWNNIDVLQEHPVLAGIDRAAQFYFVHSFYPEPSNAKSIIAATSYGVTFASVIARKNIVATQFHPEKSGRPGLKLLFNFSKWNGDYSAG